MRGYCAGHRRNPKLPARSPNSHCAVGRKLDVFTPFTRAIHFAQQALLALVHVHRPHLLDWPRDIARRIRNFPHRVEFTAARKNHRAAVRCEPQARERHAVVAGIMRDLAGNKARGIRNPNIANAFSIEDPNDARHARRRRQVFGKRGTHHLLDGEALRSSNARS